MKHAAKSVKPKTINLSPQTLHPPPTQDKQSNSSEHMQQSLTERENLKAQKRSNWRALSQADSQKQTKIKIFFKNKYISVSNFHQNLNNFRGRLQAQALL